MALIKNDKHYNHILIVSTWCSRSLAHLFIMVYFEDWTWFLGHIVVLNGLEDVCVCWPDHWFSKTEDGWMENHYCSRDIGGPLMLVSTFCSFS